MNEISITGTVPIVINARVKRAGEYHEGGPTAVKEKIEPYILLSALPEKLRKQVVDAVNVIITGP